MNLRDKPFFLTTDEEKMVLEKVESMTVEEKVGQLFCIMATEKGPDIKELKTMVGKYHVGGILFRPAPLEWIKKQYEILDEITDLPLLKAANLEEGGVGAISDGTFFSWPMGVAATDDIEMAKKHAISCAVDGKQVGINWTFSPVTDINYNYRNPIVNIRSYGSSPDRVLEYAREYVKTIQEYGIAACAKHFPGDGVDYRDQHLHPTYNSFNAEQWLATYGKNYKTLIDDGLMSIMVGHIVQPYVSMWINPELSLEDCLPASLSHEMLTGLLREKYNFNGVITSDATIMTGFIQAMDREKAIPLAIEAGCDMLVFNINFYEDYEYMLQGVKKGILSMHRLDHAVSRTLAMRIATAKYEMSANMPNENKAWAKECAEKSITLVKNLKESLPITKEKYDEIMLIPLGKDETAEKESISEVLRECFEKEEFKVSVFDEETMMVTSSKNTNKKILKLHFANIGAISNNTAVRLFWNGRGAANSPKFVTKEDDIFVSFANPYHLQDVPRIKTYINCYNNSRVTIETLVEKLLGRSEFTGSSPVDPYCGLVDTHL